MIETHYVITLYQTTCRNVYDAEQRIRCIITMYTYSVN